MRTPLSALKGGGRVTRGIVSSGGAIVGGTGFTVIRTAVGVYTVTFLTPFAARPDVQIWTSGFDVAWVSGASPTPYGFAFTISRPDTGASQDSEFTFVATEQER